MKLRSVVICVVIVVCIALIIISWYSIQKSIKSMYRPVNFVTSPLRECSILTYNIQKFPWSFKSFDPAVSLLRQYSIVMLQECFDDTFDSLSSIFPDHFIFRGTLHGINVMNSGLAVLSRFPIIDAEFIMFDNYNALSFDAFSEKGFLSVVVDVHGTRLRLINTHLQSCDFDRFDPNAMNQLDELLRYIKIHNKNMHYIIGGDFNIDVEDLREHYHNFSHLYYPRNPTIFINFTTSHSKSTKKLGYDGLTFDYFITSKKVEMTEPQVCVSDYSDHNAVASSFRLL